MKFIFRVLSAVFMFFCVTVTSFCQDTGRPWEKYGLSQSEWKIVMDNKIPLDKVPVLISAGISIKEFSEKPWVELGLTEGEWIEKRRAGLTSYDIEVDAKLYRRKHRVDLAVSGKSSYDSYSSGKNQLISLIFPGLQQLRLNQLSRGRIMAGVAIASLVVCFAGAVAEDRFEARPLYMVLAPDMLWSFIDFKITLGKMKKGKR